jgi:hypothetical protein
MNAVGVFYRPPWGHFNMFTPLFSKKYKVIMWSGIFGDWKVENCKSTLLDQLQSTSTEGSILLLHDCGETLGADKEAPGYMIEMLKIYLQESKEKGTTLFLSNITIWGIMDIDTLLFCDSYGYLIISFFSLRHLWCLSRRILLFF